MEIELNETIDWNILSNATRIYVQNDQYEKKKKNI